MPIPEVNMPNPGDKPRKRTESANAFTVNEPGKPTRSGNNPQQLAASLAGIIDWLSPETAGHRRYQPTAATFCNIYAHDYCHLAGVYLPRVWWKSAALEKLKAGETVQPVYDATIREMTANDLVPWLKEHGPSFGWRASTSLTDLQNAANNGAVVVMAARATGHGHIVAVVPELGGHTAKRDGGGQVTTPLQSQAGRRNFNYGSPQPNWWLSGHTDPGFWIHD